VAGGRVGRSLRLHRRGVLSRRDGVAINALKRISAGQLVTVLANLGVIAGIVLLAYELDQNNRLLRAQASYELFSNRVGIRRELANASDQVAGFWVRVNSRAPLTATDELRLTAFVESIFLSLEFEYIQTIEGNLDESELPVEAYRAAYRGRGFANIGVLPDVWLRLRSTLRPDFVEWMEANVINERQ
jgi:hypothetical protein